ncbi:photosynthesis system II assembly factor Ycf48 [Tumidithrix elongata]|uniref:photosynthesis system II assembly factor Ycf48 n=1 Tax=Tumidithrix elongata TaxID=3088357 RepID=UPI0038CD9FAD
MNKKIKRVFAFLLACVVLFCVSVTATVSTGVEAVAASESGTWQQVELPTKSTLLDMTFSNTDPNHGWLVGTDATLLETHDAGKTWQPQKLDLGDNAYRFVSVSFTGNEGWIAGKPALLLHTEDGGQSWSRIGLSSKLPGEPTLVKALAPKSAEMATDIGAIYRTDDSGQNWKALVTQAVGAVRNLYRNDDGRYIAVSAKGNFYSTWSPGEQAWTQHNRNSSRRVQNMGYAPDGRTWMLNRGGVMQFSEVGTLEKWQKALAPKAANGLGLLDLVYQDEENIWVTGGSSRLLHSQDQGKTWQRDESTKNIGANFYRIYFFGRDRGFILGQDGTLLAYSQP